MPKPSPSLGSISIKGTKNADHIVIGESPYIYSTADQNRGFVIDGANGNDVLAGGIGVDRISGGSGSDTIVAQEEDILGAPSGTIAYDGGLDSDLLDFSAWTKGIALDLGTTGAGGDRYYANFSMGTPTSLAIELDQDNDPRTVTTAIENVSAGSGNDYLAGDWGANVLQGNAGDDYLEGKRGNDQLFGGAGDDLIVTGIDNDVVSGGDGNDIFAVAGATAGAYYVTSVVDFDRQNDGTAAFDRVWIYDAYNWHFDTTADGTLKIVYGSDSTGALGEIVLQGLTSANQGDVVVEPLNLMTGMPA